LTCENVTGKKSKISGKLKVPLKLYPFFFLFPFHAQATGSQAV
jgi:hypothetical protein